MGIIQYFVLVLIVGLFVYAINRWAPIPEPFKQLILWSGVAVCVLVLASALGLFGWDTQIPRLTR